MCIALYVECTLRDEFVLYIECTLHDEFALYCISNVQVLQDVFSSEQCGLVRAEENELFIPKWYVTVFFSCRILRRLN